MSLCECHEDIKVNCDVSVRDSMSEKQIVPRILIDQRNLNRIRITERLKCVIFRKRLENV